MALELINIKTMTLTNEYLQAEIGNMILAERDTKNATWKISKSMSNILKDKLWEDDFEKDKDLFDLLGVKKSWGSLCVTACEMQELYKLDMGVWTVRKAYELKAIENIEDFKVWLSNNDYPTFEDLYGVSDKCFMTLIKEYTNKDKQPEQEVIDNDTETEQDTEQENTDIAIIEWCGATYHIPVNVLEQYKVQ